MVPASNTHTEVLFLESSQWHLHVMTVKHVLIWVKKTCQFQCPWPKFIEKRHIYENGRSILVPLNLIHFPVICHRGHFAVTAVSLCGIRSPPHTYHYRVETVLPSCPGTVKRWTNHICDWLEVETEKEYKSGNTCLGIPTICCSLLSLMLAIGADPA